MKPTAAVLAILLLLATFPAACAHRPPQEPAGGGPQPGPDPLSLLIRFYQGPLNHLSAVRRGECPMAPSCAQYAQQAIAAHGPLVGWVMALDRLMRCGRDETAAAPTVRVGGQAKYYDPVSANDFWWHGR